MQHTQAHPAFEYGCRFFAYYYIGEKKKINRFFKFGRRINRVYLASAHFFPSLELQLQTWTEIFSNIWEYLCGGYFGFAQLPRWDLGIMGAVKLGLDVLVLSLIHI